ncbi:hypothetical protein AWY89_10855 [Pasteurella multocida subsp. multocida]|nr:hypothetical protein AWY89_10855 [Pasteurella multocida subsp. multocida]
MAEELGSDEDDIDEDGQEYLEILAKQAGEDGDDEDWEEDDAEETALEGYSTMGIWLCESTDPTQQGVGKGQLLVPGSQSPASHTGYDRGAEN